MLFFDDLRTLDFRGSKCSEGLSKISIYPNFDSMGVSRVRKFKKESLKKNLKIDFCPKTTPQKIVTDDLHKR